MHKPVILLWEGQRSMPYLIPMGPRSGLLVPPLPPLPPKMVMLAKFHSLHLSQDCTGLCVLGLQPRSFSCQMTCDVAVLGQALPCDTGCIPASCVLPSDWLSVCQPKQADVGYLCMSFLHYVAVSSLQLQPLTHFVASCIPCRAFYTMLSIVYCVEHCIPC